MPNFQKLAEQGCYHRLGTTYPSISPVAWSSFSTGTNPAKHNIYDFLDRDWRTYLPKLSSTRIGDVKKFFCLEGNLYEAEVLLKIKVLADGETVWAGVAGGSSKRFGRSYKADNYYECLSDALIDAVVNLFKVETFRQAVVDAAAK